MKTNFQTYNKIIKKNIRLAKKLYYHQLLLWKKKFHMKNKWKIIKEALGKLKKKYENMKKYETLLKRTICAQCVLILFYFK